MTYDLGNSYIISQFALWNEESSGIGQFNLLASTDNISFAPVLNGVSPVDNPLSDYTAQLFSLGTVSARYIRLDLSDCPQPDPGSFNGCGIGEVAFDAQDASDVPAPLPILGAAAAFRCTRKLRLRIKASKAPVSSS